MTIKTPRPGRPGRSPPQTPTLHQPGPDVNVDVSAGGVRLAQPGAAHEVKPFNAAAQEAAHDLVAALCDPSLLPKLPEALRRMFDVVLLRVGYVDTIESVERPQSVDKLVPAADSIFKMLPMLCSKVPAVEDLDLDGARTDLGLLKFLQGLKGGADVSAEKLDLMMRVLEDRLATFAYKVWDLGEKEIKRSVDLKREMFPLWDFDSGAAAKSVESRQANQQLRDETEQKTVEKVKEALGKSSATPSPAGGSGMPAIATGAGTPPVGLPELPTVTAKGRRRARTPKAKA